MSKYLGDFSASAVIDFKFTTFRPSTGAPFTLAGTPEVSVYKDNDLAQTITGVALTVDFDGVTGLNHVRVTTTDAFYANGSEFECVITAGTVDSVSVVGSCVGRFTLRSQASLYPTAAGNTLDVNANGEAGIDWANVGNPTTTLALTNTTIANVTVGSISANAITAASIATDAITAAKIATGAIDADAIAADAITSAKIADSAITIRLATDGTASEARIVTGAVASDVWNALLASYTTVNTFGARVVRTIASPVTNEVSINASNHLAANVHQMQANVVTAASIATDAIDADALATDAVTEIVNGVWSRDPSDALFNGLAGYWLYQAGLNSQQIGSDTGLMTGTAYIESIGDALLNRNVGGGSNSGRLVKEALYALRNKSEIVGTTLRVYDAGDALSWTAAVASSASADPVTGIDP